MDECSDRTAGWRRDLPVVFSYFSGARAGGVAGASKLGKHDRGSLAPSRTIRNMSATSFDLRLTSAPLQTLYSLIHLAVTPSFQSPIVAGFNKSSMKSDTEGRQRTQDAVSDPYSLSSEDDLSICLRTPCLPFQVTRHLGFHPRRFGQSLCGTCQARRAQCP